MRTFLTDCAVKPYEECKSVAHAIENKVAADKFWSSIDLTNRDWAYIRKYLTEQWNRSCKNHWCKHVNDNTSQFSMGLDTSTLTIAGVSGWDPPVGGVVLAIYKPLPKTGPIGMIAFPLPEGFNALLRQINESPTYSDQERVNVPVPEPHIRALPLPAAPTFTNCTPNVVGGGFNCTTY
jgi:hypothetical protein